MISDFRSNYFKISVKFCQNKKFLCPTSISISKIRQNIPIFPNSVEKIDWFPCPARIGTPLPPIKVHYSTLILTPYRTKRFHPDFWVLTSLFFQIACSIMKVTATSTFKLKLINYLKRIVTKHLYLKRRFTLIKEHCNMFSLCMKQLP